MSKQQAHAKSRQRPTVSSNPRAIAAQVVLAVIQHKSDIDTALQHHSKPDIDPRDRALSQRLAYNTLRWLPALRYFTRQLLSKPLPQKEQLIECLICVGLVQLWHEKMPVHAVTHSTVEAAVGLKKSWAKGLINACLRRFQREKQELVHQLESQDAQYALPADWLQLLRSDWPNRWQQIALASHAEAPLWLRVNRQRCSRDEYLTQLQAAEITAEAGPTPDAVLITKPQPVQTLPGFTSGDFAVQDIAAQRCVEVLDLQPGQDVLDACAAPGGKTCHILEAEPALTSLTAVDRDSARVEKIHENLQRLNLSSEKITVRCCDAASAESWGKDQRFDRILLDAPCSASGVVRRHPEIPWRRRTSSVTALNQLQEQLLDQMWLLLKPGGMLVYITCSIFASENQDQIQQFLQRHPNAKPVPLPHWGVARGIGRQFLPGMDNADGFFYAAVRHDITA